ncbi:hypothetical protein HLB44_22375 [Aquincola sp. S2]|uniref:PH domain-containing protein n=1 Tax=Pseudaquabacterium terrae TaxID=2732868 RepID=A0ABX2EM94_9BURK|nr:hypothetical protein [Aquabacterium terrae]NRF69755.1 hypothetical protein [Aquabacterium terrae]
MSIRRVKPWRHPAEQRYRLRGWRRWLMWWMFAPLLFGGLWLAGSAEAGAGAAGAVLLLVAGTALAGWEWVWRRTTLELSAAGLRLRQVGYTLETPWSNVAGFHAERMHEGFVLAQPLDTPSARRLGFFSGLSGLHDGEQAGWIAECRFIPIEAFAWHLRKGTLVADVSARAPHLAAAMSAVNAPAPPAPPPAPAQRRRALALGLFVAAVIVLSAVLGWTQPAGLNRVLQIAYAVVAPLVALQAGIGTWQFARGRHWGMALLMAAVTLMALGWCAVAWQAVG